MSDLHPYDDKTRLFQHTDPDPSEGLVIAAGLLGRPAGSLVDARYRLSFYSGGFGIIDKLAISVACDDPPSVFAARDDLWSPEELAADAELKAGFLWLVEDEDAPLPVAEAAARFVNAERQPFQPACAPDALWFESISGVNAWTATWLAEGRLNLLAFDQG